MEGVHSATHNIISVMVRGFRHQQHGAFLLQSYTSSLGHRGKKQRQTMKNITNVVNTDIYQVSKESNRLKQLVSQCMPVELAEQILFARIADQKLRITVSNSAWAARLRFHSREIMLKLAGSRTPVNDISVHVLPQNKTLKVAPRESVRLKPRATDSCVSTIRQVANSMDNDEDGNRELGRALGRLAKNLEKEQ